MNTGTECSAVFAIVHQDEDFDILTPDTYTTHPMSGGWNLLALNSDIFNILIANGGGIFKVMYSPAAEELFGYIDVDMRVISADRATRFYVKPSAAHFLGLMLGWSVVDNDGNTWHSQDGDNWMVVNEECWMGDIDSVILNLVMPKEGGGACGCGDNYAAVLALHKFLGTQLRNPLVADDAEQIQHLNDTTYRNDLMGQAFWFIAYVLDAAGFTEHGGNVCHGWLTNKGVILALLIGESMKLSAEANVDE